MHNLIESGCGFGPPEDFKVRLTWHTWWRHQMETFSTLPSLCAGNSPVTGELPAQRSVTRSFDVSFDLLLNKHLSKQWWGWWFETPSRPLWRHCNDRGCLTCPWYHSSFGIYMNNHPYWTFIFSLMMHVAMNRHIIKYKWKISAWWRYKWQCQRLYHFLSMSIQ